MRLRTGLTVFGWAAAILNATACFFWTAYTVEVPWMERMGDDSTGTAVATSWMAAPVLLVLLLGALLRFRDARSAVVIGWLASLPLFAALYVAAYSSSYCGVPGCATS